MSSKTRTFNIDGPNTHGVAGLASVGVEDGSGSSAFAGIGPDDQFTGTSHELAGYLQDQGFNKIETEDPHVQSAWQKAQGKEVPTMSANARVLILERVEPAKPDGTAAAVYLAQIDWGEGEERFIEVHVTEAGARQAIAAALAPDAQAYYGWVERIEVQSP